MSLDYILDSLKKHNIGNYEHHTLHNTGAAATPMTPSNVYPSSATGQCDACLKDTCAVHMVREDANAFQHRPAVPIAATEADVLVQSSITSKDEDGTLHTNLMESKKEAVAAPMGLKSQEHVHIDPVEPLMRAGDDTLKSASTLEHKVSTMSVVKNNTIRHQQQQHEMHHPEEVPVSLDMLHHLTPETAMLVSAAMSKEAEMKHPQVHREWHGGEASGPEKNRLDDYSMSANMGESERHSELSHQSEHQHLCGA